MGNKASTPTWRGSRYSASPRSEDDRRRSWRPRLTPSATVDGTLASGQETAGSDATPAPARARAGSTGSMAVRCSGGIGGGSGGGETGYGGADDESDDDGQGLERPSDMSWYQMAKVGYQELVNAIIRPPRAEYEIEALGPVEFEFVGKAFKREDFQLRNERGHLLQCSHWQPNGWRVAERIPCIVYMHGNSSARVEALPQLSLALTLGASLVAFDFSGSGLSEGEHVSLGYYEKDDVKVVIDYLRRSGTVGAIALWGRSMGAATALLHADRDMSIAALVLDSAFADLTQLAEEMVERGRQAGLTVPGFVVKLVLRMIRGSVTKTAGFNVRDLCPIMHADRTFIPALFVAGRGDDFIRPHHSQQIHDKYAGDKNIVLVEGDHNSPRPSFLFDSVYIFLQTYLQVPAEWGLYRTDIPMGYPPWYMRSSSAAPFGRDGGLGLDDLSDYVDWDPHRAAALRDDVGDNLGVNGAVGLGMTDARQQEFLMAQILMLAQEHNVPATRAIAATTEEDGRGANQQPERGRNSTGRLGARSTAGTDVQPSRSSPELDQQQKQQYDRPRRKASSQDGASRSRGETLEPNGYGNDTIAEESPCCTSPRGPDGGLRLEGHQEGVKEGEAAVAAVAAAAVSSRGGGGGGGGVTACTPIGAGHITPTGLPRPVMAPFSMSDTSSQAASPEHLRRFGWRGIGGSSHLLKTSDSEAGAGGAVSPEGGGVEGSAAGGRGGRVSVASIDDVMWLPRDAKGGPSPAKGKGSLGEGASDSNRVVVGGAALETGVEPLKGKEPLAALPNGDGRRDDDHSRREKGHIFRDSGVVSGERAGREKGAGGSHIFLGSENEVDAGQSATERRCRIFRDGASETGDGGGKSGDGQAARASGGARCIFRPEGGDSDGEKFDVGRVHIAQYRGEPEAAGGAASLSHGRGGGGGGGGVLSYGGGARSDFSDGMIGFPGSGASEGGGAVLDAGVGYRGGAAQDLPTDASSSPPSVADDGLLGIRLSEMQWSCSRCTLINVVADRECKVCGGIR